MKKNDLTRRGFVSKVSFGSLVALLAHRIPALGKAPRRSSDVGLSSENSEKTWLEVGGKLYGARPDKRGPIGGGTGYSATITKGDYEVKTLESLIDALSKAKSGQVIYIPSETEIDLTSSIYIEGLVLIVPEGVTLSGDRGYKGSKGAIFTSDSLKTPVIFQIGGPDVRITGLRIQGPNPKRYVEHHTKAFGKDGLGRDYYYKFPVSRCITTQFPRLEVDNCDISGFTQAIMLDKGKDHHIHHNRIHKCQYKGLGYGVCHDVASSLIEYNVFDANRHSLAGTGRPGCGYVARHNVELGISLSHCFDMHGGRDRKDGTTIAGTSIEIYNNTFMSAERAVGIRGEPEEKCIIHHNWILKHANAKKAVMGETKTSVYDNLYGEHPVKPE